MYRCIPEMAPLIQTPSHSAILRRNIFSISFFSSSHNSLRKLTNIANAVNVRDICDELGADYDCAVTGLGERPRHLKSGENIRAGEMSDEANIHG